MRQPEKHLINFHLVVLVLTGRLVVISIMKYQNLRETQKKMKNGYDDPPTKFSVRALLIWYTLSKKPMRKPLGSPSMKTPELGRSTFQNTPKLEVSFHLPDFPIPSKLPSCGTEEVLPLPLGHRSAQRANFIPFVSQTLAAWKIGFLNWFHPGFLEPQDSILYIIHM